MSEIELRGLAQRLWDLGYPAAEVETGGGVPAVLVDRGSGRRAAVVPVEVPVRCLRRALASLAALSPERPLVPIAWGAPPRTGKRRSLRGAGLELALYEPLDPSVLRFQLNRALAGTPGEARRTPRAPVDWLVELRAGWSWQPARVYTLSSAGAYLATEKPLRPGRRLALEIPLGLDRSRTRAQVVLANSGDARRHPDLPPGMAVSFRRIDDAAVVAIERFVGTRLASLAV